jgi:spoIIIJ-associated protein
MTQTFVDTMIPVTKEIAQSEIKTLGNLLETLIKSAGFQLEFNIQQDPGAEAANAAPAVPAVPSTQQTPAAGRIRVEFSGVDTTLLTSRNGELLNALEYIGAKVLKLEQEDHDHISFDADSFKANRDRDLRRSAEEAIASVRRTGRPYAFAPMTSHERRLLHMALSESGLPTASSGEVPRRYVVLYPENYRAAATGAVSDSLPGEKRSVASGERRDPAKTEDRAHAIRSSFRRR